MGAFSWLRGGNDRQLADDMRAADSRRNRAGHRRSGARDAARDGQAWEDRDRANDRRGGWYRNR